MPRNTISEFIGKIKGYGLTALLAVGLGIVSLIFGYLFISGICFGVFFTRNWDIIEKYLREELNVI